MHPNHNVFSSTHRSDQLIRLHQHTHIISIAVSSRNPCMHPGIVMMTAHPTPAHSETPTCLTLTSVGQHPEGLEHRPRDATYLHALHHHIHIHIHTTPRVVPWCLVHRYHLPSAIPDRSRSLSYNLPTPVPVPPRHVASHHRATQTCSATLHK